MSGRMFSVSEEQVHIIVRSARLSLLLVFGILLGTSRAAVQDSLSIKDKAQINGLAKSQHETYQGVLLSIARSDVESESAAIEVQELIGNVCAGPGRLFINANAIIQDDIDPDLRPGSSSLNRKVTEYLNDLFTYFRAEGNEPIGMNILSMGEPAAGNGQSAYTKVLYEVVFNGHYKGKNTPYARHKRVMQLMAERKGERDWQVLIASDDWYDEAKGFVAYQLETDIKEGAASTPEMVAYERYARQIAEDAKREREERKRQFDAAIEQGNKLLMDGDFETAIDLYKQAGKIDPLSIEPIVRVKKTERAWEVKKQNDKKQVDDLVRQSEDLKAMREYDRALLAVQDAIKVIPDDPRCGPLRDSLQVLARMKADREAAFSTGNYEACVKAEKDRLRQNPSDAQALTLLARCYHKLNRRSDALDHVERALKIEPFLGDALFLRAQLYEVSDSEEDKRKAGVDYDVLMRHDPWKMEYVQRSAYLTCWRQRNCRKASDLLKSALSRAPHDVETLYWLGRVHGFGTTGQLAEYNESLKYLDQAIAVDSTCGKCYLERGVTLLMMDSVTSATRSVELAKRFRLPEGEWRRVRNLARENVADASEQQKKGFYTQAAKRFTAACVLHPDTAIYWAYSAGNLMMIPHYGEAIDAWDRYIALVDADYNGRLDRAYCLLRLGRYDAALSEVDRVQRNDIKGDFAVKSNRVAGEAAFLKGDYAGAEKYLKESYRRDKENPEVLSMLAQVTYARGSYKEAEGYCEDAIDVVRKAKGEKGGEDPKSHFYLGLIRQKMGDAKKSIVSFEEARSYGYKSSEVEKSIGRSRMLLEDWKGAILNFQEVKRDTLDPEAIISMAECMKREKRYREALTVMNELEQDQPEVALKPEFLAEMGLLYVLNDMMNEARASINKAYAADPDYRKTILARIAMFWKGSQQEDAVRELSTLYDRSQVTDKELKDWPILSDMIDSPMWKKRVK